MFELELKGRTKEVEQLVQECAGGKLSFSVLCEKVSAMGYKTTSLYEMVRAAELQTNQTE